MKKHSSFDYFCDFHLRVNRKMTSCKLRVKLRVDFYKKNSADSCESALMRTSVARHLTNNNRIYEFL